MLRKPLFAAMACAFALVPAWAQTYRDAAGTIIPGFVLIPFPYTPMAPGQHNIAPTSATALAAPQGARFATLCASGATVRYTTDGVTTPTASVGQPLGAGSCVSLSGPAVLSKFLAISPTGTLDVEYFQ